MTTTAELRIERMALDEIEGALENPKRHAIADLRASITRFGYAEPVVLDERTQRLVAGHGRLETLVQLRDDGATPPPGIAEHDGMWMVPVLRGWASKDDVEAKAYLAASNQTTIAGGWERSELVALLSDVQTKAGLTGTGFNNDDLAELRRLLTRADKAARTDPDQVPPKPKKSKTKPGDVYLLGEHRLMCADSRDSHAVERVLGGAPIDLVFTDPPYGVSYQGKTKDALTIDNDELTGAALQTFLEGAFAVAAEHCRPGAAWYVCGPAGPNSHAFGAVLGSMGIWRQTIVWVKDRWVLGRSDYHYRHELLFEGSLPEPAGDVADDGYEDIRFGWLPGAAHREPPDRRQDTVWEISRPAASRLHPTMKPVELVLRAIENSSAPGELVYDAFTGSGSTLIAAYSSDRVFVGLEKDPVYVDVICRRWEEHTGITPVLDGKGARSFLENNGGE